MKIKPLTALAVGIGMLGMVQAGRLALNATNAMAAAEAPAAAPADPKAAAGAPADPKAAAEAAVPTCIPVDLAKEAGISAAEFRLLQSLQDRRQQLDQRERDIITRQGVITAADQRLQARLDTLKGVEANIQSLLGQVDQAEEARIANLVRVYERMDPKDSARVLEGLDNEVLLQIASRMRDQKLSLILAKMSAPRAREITMLLAQIERPDVSALNNNAPAASPATTPAGNRPATPAPNNAQGRQAANSPTSTNPARPSANGANGANRANGANGANGAAANNNGPTPPNVPNPSAPNVPAVGQGNQARAGANSGANSGANQAPQDPASRARAGNRG